MNTIKYLTILLALMLFGCGTSEIIKRSDSNYSVSAQYGSVNGSWSRASSEAVAKAEQHCKAQGLKYVFINENRSGVVGWSPQVSEVTFSCGPDTQSLLTAQQDDCKSEILDEALNPIRSKVELIRPSTESAVPFDIASNDSYPTEIERVAIAKWAKIREECVNKRDALLAGSYKNISPMQMTFIHKDMSYIKEMDGRLSELIVALYQSKLSYSEFALKRLEITRSLVSAQRDYRASMLIADRENQNRAQQLAEQQLQNRLMTWGVYMQSVNMRQPQSVNCTSRKFGNTVTTDCR